MIDEDVFFKGHENRRKCRRKAYKDKNGKGSPWGEFYMETFM